MREKYSKIKSWLLNQRTTLTDTLFSHKIIGEPKVDTMSQFQKVIIAYRKVAKNKRWGNILCILWLDNVLKILNVTDRGRWIYLSRDTRHEMIVHVPMMVHFCTRQSKKSIDYRKRSEVEMAVLLVRSWSIQKLSPHIKSRFREVCHDRIDIDEVVK